MNTENTARVDAYLDQVLAPLTRHLSQLHRDELRRELREHLWARIDAYRELGMNEADAVTEALRQFGGAEDFLRQWRREWRPLNRSDALREILTAARPALRLSLLALSMNIGIVALAFFTFRSPLGGPFLEAVFSALILAGMALSPIVLGVAQSRQALRRPSSGMFVALAAEIVGVAGLSWIIMRMGLDQTMFGLFSALPLIVAVWLPIACTSAAVSGWWMQRSKSRRLA